MGDKQSKAEQSRAEQTGTKQAPARALALARLAPSGRVHRALLGAPHHFPSFLAHPGPLQTLDGAGLPLAIPRLSWSFLVFLGRLSPFPLPPSLPSSVFVFPRPGSQPASSSTLPKRRDERQQSGKGLAGGCWRQSRLALLGKACLPLDLNHLPSHVCE